MIFPSTACLLQAKLALARTVIRPCSSSSGFVYALSTAITHESGHTARALCRAEVYRAYRLEDRATCVLFWRTRAQWCFEKRAPGILASRLHADDAANSVGARKRGAMSRVRPALLRWKARRIQLAVKLLGEVALETLNAAAREIRS